MSDDLDFQPPPHPFDQHYCFFEVYLNRALAIHKVNIFPFLAVDGRVIALLKNGRMYVSNFVARDRFDAEMLTMGSDAFEFEGARKEAESKAMMLVVRAILEEIKENENNQTTY